MFIMNYFRNDFNRVRGAMLMLTNDKMPMWLSVILYIVLLPIGIVLMPFAMLCMLYVWVQIKRTNL